MTTHNTGNPVPSTAVKDLYDNAENLDIAMNTASLTWTDRLGGWRPTMAGLEKRVNDVLAGTGLSHLEGDYQAGGVVVSHNQWFDGPDGAAWKLIASVPVPFTFTGDFDADRVNFQPIPDLALRGELADPENGANLIGWRRNILDSQVSSVSQMLSASMLNVWEFADLVVKHAGSPSSWDWQAAINAAFDHAKLFGMTLFFPDFDYAIRGGVVAKSNTLFSANARLIAFLSSPSDIAYLVSLEARGTTQENVQVRNGNFDGSESSASGYGIFVDYNRGDITAYGAYNITLINPWTVGFEWGQAIRCFQINIFNPRSTDCKHGLAMSGTSGSNESGVINIYGGRVNGCFDTTISVGLAELTPETIGVFNGSSINVYGTQNLGTVRIRKVANFAMFGCNYEFFDPAHGSGTAIEILEDCYGVSIISPFFSKYRVAIDVKNRCRGLSVISPHLYNIKESALRINEAYDAFEYKNPSRSGSNFTEGQELNIGMPSVAPEDLNFGVYNIEAQYLNLSAGTQQSHTLPPKSLRNARLTRQAKSKINAVTRPGFHYESPAALKSGTLSGSTFTFTTKAESYAFSAGDAVLCSHGAANNYGVIVKINYSEGSAVVSGAYSATALSATISQLSNSWEDERIYSEGNQDVTLTPQAGSITLYSNMNSVSWEKNGKTVTVRGNISVQSVSSATGYFSMNLPFPVSDLPEGSGTSAASVISSGLNTLAVSGLCAFTVEGSNELRFYKSDTNVLAGGAEQLKTDSNIRFCVSYRTSS